MMKMSAAMMSANNLQNGRSCFSLQVLAIFLLIIMNIQYLVPVLRFTDNYFCFGIYFSICLSFGGRQWGRLDGHQHYLCLIFR